MRFRRFDLLAFGKFTNVSLELLPGPPDLHVIYGPNEAGKSTLREAMVDFLYGISGQTAQNFVHHYSRMRLGATVEARLLSWAIQRYRESHQGPLLHRAGELFAALTLGSFERLTVEDEGDGAMIVARRGGDELGVDAMSEGTRDQLYLALRVAALELHLDKGEPLPFLADDLFVNWDNDRAKAGLRLLAELARRTQVLFLTHHEHLIALAREAVGADCSTLALGE